MFGAVAKSYFAEKVLDVDPKDIFCVSIMPCTAKKAECDIPNINDSEADKDVDIVLMVSKIKKIKAKDNSYMAFIDGTDNINKINLVAFKNVYDDLNNIEVNDIIHVNGHVEKRYNDYQIVVKKIEKID